ncbi:MAG: ribosome maturation factor RimM [Gammaproteobacteria bacterium]|nr:ribosome maturation factor RimM [Gammaproteobacteria bacterium]
MVKHSVTVNRIKLGRINAAYGLKGWLKVYSETDPIEQILTYSPWQLQRGDKEPQPEKEAQPEKEPQQEKEPQLAKELQVEVEKGKIQGRSLIVLLAGVEDRNQAESMIGYEVWIDRARLPGLEQGEYYWHQLEGLKVVNQSGAVLGKVDHLMETGANDVMVVKPVTGSIDDTERLIPFVQDKVVKDVNIETAIIVVAWESDY